MFSKCDLPKKLLKYPKSPEKKVSGEYSTNKCKCSLVKGLIRRKKHLLI